MDSIHVYGGNLLKGETKIQGSKNAVLPILAASLLVDGVCEISNCPRIADVYLMQNLLRGLGCRVEWTDKNTVVVDASCVNDSAMSGESVTRMRSSIMLLGPMLGRLGDVSMAYPGGCVIGKRPIDIHLDALKCMGVEIEEKDCFFTAKVHRLNAVALRLPFPSVGATENVILAAILAEGTTILDNAATEPEITALCEFLTAAGAGIEGIGTSKISIHGVKKLRDAQFRIPADRIVAGTYLIAALTVGGSVFLLDAPVKQLSAVLNAVEMMGGSITVNAEGVGIDVLRRAKALPYLRTQIYDGFPTDLQSPMLAAMALAKGESILEETIFENRFRVVNQLRAMGANITHDSKRAYIKGVKSLRGAYVEAEELRGGAALTAAGLAAAGKSIIVNRHFIERGYEDICRDLRNLGADLSLG